MQRGNAFNIYKNVDILLLKFIHFILECFIKVIVKVLNELIFFLYGKFLDLKKDLIKSIQIRNKNIIQKIKILLLFLTRN